MNHEFDIYSARILIVDDLPANVALLEQLLAQAGYKNVSSTMAPQTVGALHAANNYNLILLDLKMPDMDGFAVMAELEKITTGSYLPVIVLTAEPGLKLRALQAGAKDFISQPFDLIEVKTRIYNMLEVRMLYDKLDKYSQLLEFAARQSTQDMHPPVH